MNNLQWLKLAQSKLVPRLTNLLANMASQLILPTGPKSIQLGPQNNQLIKAAIKFNLDITQSLHFSAALTYAIDTGMPTVTHTCSKETRLHL